MSAGRDPYANVVWRVGRKLGRTVYAQAGPEPSDADELLGLMETRSLAEEVVRLHNAHRDLCPDHTRGETDG